MKRWKWLWILPALIVLAVGLGCQSEKPTAQAEEGQLKKQVLSCSSDPALNMIISQGDLEARAKQEDISFCDAIDVLNANNVSFEECKEPFRSFRYCDICKEAFGDYTYDYGCVTTKAKEILALQAEQVGWELVFGSDPGFGPSENQWVIPRPGAKCVYSIDENYERDQARLSAAVETELESLGLSEKKRPETWEEFLAQHSDREKPFVEKYLRERWDDPPVCELTTAH